MLNIRQRLISYSIKCLLRGVYKLCMQRHKLTEMNLMNPIILKSCLWLKKFLCILEPKGVLDTIYTDIIHLGLWFLNIANFGTLEKGTAQDYVSIMNWWRINSSKRIITNMPKKSNRKTNGTLSAPYNI